jgi:DNA-binding protein YbaB
MLQDMITEGNNSGITTLEETSGPEMQVYPFQDQHLTTNSQTAVVQIVDPINKEDAQTLQDLLGQVENAPITRAIERHFRSIQS